MIKWLSVVFLFLWLNGFAQVENNPEPNVVVTETIDTISVETLNRNPLQASLYSAVLPGLGQMYNKKYWKAPLVWGLLGTGVGFTLYFNKQYKRYREAYIAQLNGEPHEFSNLNFSDETLGRAQNDRRRDRDYAIAITTLVYILNILDATVDAHLYEVRKDKDLGVDPQAYLDPVTQQPGVGLSLTLNF